MLAPSERYAEGEQIKHKKVTDWARQLLLLKRWLPKRKVIAVGDSSYAVIDLLAPLGGHVAFITRLRLDAGLPARGPGKPGRNRKKGERLPTLQQVLTDAATPWQKVKLTNWYGHSEIDPATYRPEEEVKRWMNLDPLPRFEHYLIENKIMTASEIDAVKAELQKEILDAVDYAEGCPESPIEVCLANVYAPDDFVNPLAEFTHVIAKEI